MLLFEMLKLCRFWTFVEADFSDLRQRKPGQISEHETESRDRNLWLERSAATKLYGPKLDLWLDPLGGFFRDEGEIGGVFERPAGA